MTLTDTPLHLDIAGSPERCLWLLDRNLVEWIMQSNGGNAKLDDKKRKMLADLTTIDREGSFISPLFSIIEGEKGRFDTADEKAACLKTESEALRRFFKYATLDSDYLERNQILASQVFTEHREAYGTQREIFFRQARKLIAAMPEKSARTMVQEQLISIAAAVRLQLSDPILVLSIACLHGNNHARAVLKPTEDAIFNTLSDVHVIGRVANVMAVGLAHDPSLSLGYLTGDEGLRGVLRFVKFGVPQVTEDGTVSTNLRYSGDLYRDLDSKKRERLTKRLELPMPFDGDILQFIHTYESITAGIEAGCYASMQQAAELRAAQKDDEWRVQRVLASGLVVAWQRLTEDTTDPGTWKEDYNRLNAIVWPERLK